MNTGAFGEGFPYTNFHDLNMDWIIKIAKDFLDQYTNIQQTITDGLEGLEQTTTDGLEGLDSKAEELENLLQQWYDTHSEDIAGELADAIADFTAEANRVGQQVIDSIPEDYTALTNSVTSLCNSILNISNGYITTGGVYTPASGYYCTALIPLYMVKSVHCMPDDTTLHIHIFDEQSNYVTLQEYFRYHTSKLLLV